MTWHDIAAHLGGAAFLGTTLRVTTPILLAALGALISDRAGVINIAVEGTMLVGAFAGVVVSAFTGSAWVGLCGAVAAGMAVGAVLAFAVHVLRADLILSGVAINIAAASGTVLWLFALTGDKGMSGALPSKVLPDITLPLGTGPVGAVLGHQHILTWAAFLAVPILSVVLRRTPFGLRLRAVGEAPSAAAAAGVRVIRTQMLALLLSGALAAAGGAFLSMGYVTWFTGGISAGRGYIAIAAEVMGGGTAFGTAIASVVLGAADALSISLQGLGLPNELMQMVPYLVPVAALVLHATRPRWAGFRRV